jgi:hypothetical protein
VYDAGRRPSRRTSEENNSRISVENAFRNYSDKKNLAYEQRGFISVSAFGLPPVAGSSPLVPYNNSQRVMKAQAMQMDWDAVRNVNDNGLVQTARHYWNIFLSDVYYAYRIWLQERVRYKFGT